MRFAPLLRLILKVSSGLVSAFTANSDTENATAVRYTKSKIERTRDQYLPQLVTILTTKAALVSGILTAHNVSSAELGLRTTTAGTWAATASKGTAKIRLQSQPRRRRTQNRRHRPLPQRSTRPLVTTFLLSTSEADRIAAQGCFAARTVIDLHGPGTPEPPAPPPPGP